MCPHPQCCGLPYRLWACCPGETQRHASSARAPALPGSEGDGGCPSSLTPPREVGCKLLFCDAFPPCLGHTGLLPACGAQGPAPVTQGRLSALPSAHPASQRQPLGPAGPGRLGRCSCHPWGHPAFWLLVLLFCSWGSRGVFPSDKPTGCLTSVRYSSPTLHRPGTGSVLARVTRPVVLRVAAQEGLAREERFALCPAG